MTYIQHLSDRLKRVDARIAIAKARHDKGDLREKVDAASELAVLEARHRELRQKIEDAKDRHAEDWSLMHTEFQEDLDALLDALDRWIIRWS